jgi:hypothetical protein
MPDATDAGFVKLRVCRRSGRCAGSRRSRELPDSAVVERMIMGVITPPVACYSSPSWGEPEFSAGRDRC